MLDRKIITLAELSSLSLVRIDQLVLCEGTNRTIIESVKLSDLVEYGNWHVHLITPYLESSTDSFLDRVTVSCGIRVLIIK